MGCSETVWIYTCSEFEEAGMNKIICEFVYKKNTFHIIIEQK